MKSRVKRNLLTGVILIIAFIVSLITTIANKDLVDQDEMNEKLTLLNAVKIVLKNSLELLGVGVKEEM